MLTFRRAGQPAFQFPGNETHVSEFSLTTPLDGALVKAPLPRVLYVLNLNPTQKFGSLEEQIVFLSRAFQQQGSSFTPLFTLARQPGLADSLSDFGVESQWLDLKRFRIATMLSLWSLVGKLGIDIVHWNMTHPLKNAYLWGLTISRPKLRHFYTDHISRDAMPSLQLSGWKKSFKRLLLRR